MPRKMTSLNASPTRVCGSTYHISHSAGCAKHIAQTDSVEIAPLVPFAFGRRLHARQLSERAEQPDRAGDRESTPTRRSASDTSAR